MMIQDAWVFIKAHDSGLKCWILVLQRQRQNVDHMSKTQR